MVCSAPNMEEEKLADKIGMERKENVENLLPERWSQQIGDEDLSHLEGRDWEEEKKPALEDKDWQGGRGRTGYFPL